MVKFLLLTFFLSWLLWLAPILSGFLLSGPPTLAMEYLFLPGTIVPALVALYLTRGEEGRLGVQSLIDRIFQWRVEMRWYLFALTFMTLIKLSAAVLHRAVAGEWPHFSFGQWYLLPLAIFFSTWIQAGEEIGWRGYALPRLTEQFGLRGASLLLGVIWAAWHLPLFFVPGVDRSDQSFPVYVIQVTAISVAMAWLWQRTKGSLLLMMFMHASINNSVSMAPAVTTDPIFSFHAPLISWLMTGVLWLAAAYFLFEMKSPEKSKVGPD